jgi:hypothetical protein
MSEWSVEVGNRRLAMPNLRFDETNVETKGRFKHFLLKTLHTI